ncbi:hypothetical protein AAE478_010232 [Parahypoxylon ruwenzoriense]
MISPPSATSTDEKRQSSFGSRKIWTNSQRQLHQERRRRYPLLSFNEIPEWYRDNPHIRQGYRPMLHSGWASFGSRAWDNEHTHSSSAGRGATHRWCSLLNFVGIILPVPGSFVSDIYVGFWCEALERRVYRSMTVSSNRKYERTDRDPGGDLCCRCIGTNVPGSAIAHTTIADSGLPYYLSEGAPFLLGAVVYATRFPESISAGTFDIYGSSRQNFHVLVIMVTVVHLGGVFLSASLNLDYEGLD